MNTISRVIFQRWEVSLTIVIKNKFVFDIVALIDLGAALNCLQEGLVPIRFYEKTKQTLSGAMVKDLPLSTSCQMLMFVTRAFALSKPSF